MAICSLACSVYCSHGGRVDNTIQPPQDKESGLNAKLVREMLKQVNGVNLASYNVDATILRGLMMEFLRHDAKEDQTEKERVAFVQHMAIEFAYQSAADMVKGMIENGDIQAQQGNIDARSMLTFLEREFRKAAADNAVLTYGAA